MRTLLALGCLVLAAGLVPAGEVLLLKYNKDTRELTVKEGDAEKTYKLGDKARVTWTDKAGNVTEVKPEYVEKLLTSDKAAGKAKLDITTDKGTVTEIRLKRKE